MQKIFLAIEDGKCMDAIVAFLRHYPLAEHQHESGDTLHFVLAHVVKDPRITSYISALPSQMTAQIFEDRKKAGITLLGDSVIKLRSVFADSTIDTLLLEGIPKVELMGAIADNKPDRIVLGSHMKRGIKALGSVSQAIANSASQNIMVVPIK